MTIDQLIEMTGAYIIGNGDLIAFYEGKHVMLGHQIDNGPIELGAEGEAILDSLGGHIDTPDEILVGQVAVAVAQVAAEEASQAAPPPPVATTRAALDDLLG